MKTLLLLFIFSSFLGTAQQDSISFTLSFLNPEQQSDFHPNDTTSLVITAKNKGMVPFEFFSTSCNEGLKAIGFEMLTSDSTYPIKLQDRIIFRNVVSTDRLHPGDSLIWEVNLIDSAKLDDVFGKGYVGIPDHITSQVYIRLRYEIHPKDTASINIHRLAHRSIDYVDYLDEDIESSIFYADATHHNDAKPDEVQKAIPEVTNGSTIPNLQEVGLLKGVYYSESIPIVYRK